VSTGTCSVAEPGAYALLRDGTTILIRPARQEDYDAVRDMHAAMSADHQYLRFFTISKLAPDEEAGRLCREPGPDHAALLAVLDGEIIGCGSFECAEADRGSAEIALAVADGMHGRGVGTLLLEHLVWVARSRGMRAFTAQTLPENTPMLRVFAGTGLPVHRVLAGDVYDVSIPLPAGEAGAALDAYRDAVAERERSADMASLRHALAPASVAVISASPDPGSAGRTILRNIVTGGFGGPVHVVSPGLAGLHGMPCLPSVAALPGQVDLAVIAAPAVAVPVIAEDCGRRGVRALVVVTSGLDRPTRAELLGTCRRYGMRLIGPGSAGVASAAVSLNATAAAWHPGPGTAGLALPSGAGEVAVLEQLSRLGIGISSFVSLGDQDDVSGTDMLRWWASDPATKLAVVHADSAGDPRKFARTARSVARTMPVLTVTAARQLIRQALSEQAGVIVTATPGDLLGAAAVLTSQPVPAGRRVAVVSSTCGAGVLAADACGDAGLQVVTLARHTQEALRDLLPADAMVAGPVVTTNATTPGTFRRCLELAGADPRVDAVLVLTAATATIDLIPGVCAASLDVPIAAAVLDQAEPIRLLAGSGENARAVPAYACPAPAARALGHAARYGTWRVAAADPADVFVRRLT
jgi:acyl-CoA synthetase (NDP forming)/GNAT superfamily N-acetyltransferase